MKRSARMQRTAKMSPEELWHVTGGLIVYSSFFFPAMHICDDHTGGVLKKVLFSDVAESVANNLQVSTEMIDKEAYRKRYNKPLPALDK